MAREERYTITSHPDIELGFSRDELEYFVTLPERGVNAETGLVLCIPGFGDSADSEYQSRKLRPYLADKYNCIVAGVNYFGISFYGSDYYQVIRDDFHFLIEKIYGIASKSYVIDQVMRFDVLANLLKQKGIKRVHSQCRILIKHSKNEYQSFGLLPAIDHLQALGKILAAYPINKKRILAFGSSYGGYIALLLGKFAPNTFSVIIDNSGYVRPSLNEITNKELQFLENGPIVNEVVFPQVMDNPWTVLDETSPFYFSDSHRRIRSLIHGDHRRETSARYYLFHSEKDGLVSINEKDMFVNVLKDKAIEVFYKRVTSSDIDGRLFKTLDHGMNASLRGLFDLVAKVDAQNLCKSAPKTDYDLETVNEFDCGIKRYSFRFDCAGGINVSLCNTHEYCAV